MTKNSVSSLDTTRIVCIDFETYYDKNECSVKTLGNTAYFAHPDFDPYLVAAAWHPEGKPYQDFPNWTQKWVGAPSAFDWSILEGATVLAHNASFDEGLYLYGADPARGWWPKIDYAEWHCTGDLSAYLGGPRSLGAAMDHWFSEPMSKDVRTAMSGRRWDSLTDERKQQVLDYAKGDAIAPLRLWGLLAPRWPRNERAASALNRDICRNGLPIDQLELRGQLNDAKQLLWQQEQAIPWVAEGKKLLSRPAFNEECRKHGIEAPASLAKNSPEAAAWIEQHGPDHLWVQATANWRRINSLCKKLESLDRAVMPEGRYYGNLLYWGAHTGRFSGSGGNLNLQNLPQGELFATDLRRLFRAAPGHKLVVADLSQIEVRTLCWLAGDTDMLARIAKSRDIYETFAVRFGLWEEDSECPMSEANPKLRNKTVKPMVLGCGFGAGAAKLALMFGMSEDEAAAAVDRYRRSLPKVPDLWGSYDKGLLASHQKMRAFEAPLPSGRSLRYAKLKRCKSTYTAKVRTWVRNEQTGELESVWFEEERIRMSMVYRSVRHSKTQLLPVWGGVVAENAAQALARDVFVDRMAMLADDYGYRKNIILHVHDELVMEVPEDRAEQALADALGCLSQSPPWISDLPLAADGKIMDAYAK